jgi:hypothetical protein
MTEMPIPKCKLAEWKASRPMRLDEYTITAEDNNRPILEGCDDPMCDCLIECGDGEQEVEGYITASFAAMPLLLAEVERLAKFEPPVCEQCGEYQENAVLAGLAPEWMCGECDDV